MVVGSGGETQEEIVAGSGSEYEGSERWCDVNLRSGELQSDGAT